MSAFVSSTRRGFARTRRATVIASGSLAVLFGALWTFSQFREVGFRREFGATGTPCRSGPLDEQLLWDIDVPHVEILAHRHNLSMSFGTSSTLSDTQAFNPRWLIFYGSSEAPHRFWIASELRDWRLCGLGARRITGDGEDFRALYLPYWLLIVLFATPPLFAFTRSRRRRNRLKRNQCPECGYPLDAATTVCPECGTARLQGTAIAKTRQI